MIGKWLNGYERMPGYVFGGWDRWIATLGNRDPVEINKDGIQRIAKWPDDRDFKEDRETDYLASRVADFIEGSAKMDAPWMAWAAIKAPHSPYKPSPRHVGKFSDKPPYRPPNFDKQGDMPLSGQNPPLTDQQKSNAAAA